MKKILAIAASAVLAASMVVGFAGCQDGGVSKDDIKVGFIFLHDETSTYDKNFIDSAKEAAKNLGLKDSQIVLRTNVPEDDECYEAAADLADSGCDVVFADSFGHESYVLKAAREFPDVEFCHATGTQAHTAGVDNFHNAFAEIYEGRYLAGVAAGMKLAEMIEDGDITAAEAKMGYVGAFPYAEVISGFTSFYLGAKSVVPEVTMTVRYTSSWYDEVAESRGKEYGKFAHQRRLRPHQPARGLSRRSQRLRREGRSQRFLQRKHQVDRSQHLYHLFPHQLDALL